MPRLGLGLGLTMGNILGVSLASTLADLYVARVATIPDFVVPSYARVVAGYEALINAWAIGTKAAFETATAMFADPSVSGYVPGAGTLLTAGAACARVGNMAWFDDNSRDLVQTTPLNQPWLLVHTGTNYVAFPGVADNGISTPDNVNNQLSTNLGFEVKATPAMLSRQSIIAAKYGNNEAEGNYNLRIDSTNQVQLILYFSGTANIYNSTVNYPFSAGVQSYIRVSRNSTTGDIKFFTSLDGVTYTQLGATVTGATGAIDYDAVPLRIGGASPSFIQPFAGAIEYLKLFKDDTFTTATQFFNPQLYNASVSQTTFTASTGEVYTLNVGTASTGFKAAFVDRTIMQGNGVNSRITSGALASRQFFTRYVCLNILNTVSGLFEYVIAGNPYENHLTYKAHSLKMRFFNESPRTEVEVDALQNRVSLFTNDFNGASSKARRNTNADTTGTTGTASSTIVNIFTGGNGTVAANAIVNTLIDTGSGVINTDAQKTAIYNYIRSINNNAF